MVVEGKTPYGKGPMRAAVFYDGSRAYLFFAAAKQKEGLKKFDRGFMATLKSLSRLTPQDKRVAKELTIQLEKARPQTSVTVLAKTSPITHHAEDQLRLLNGLFPSAEPKSGDLIKIVR